MDDETTLHGGHTSTVTRVGDTVRRGVGHWTPAVHAVLRHLSLAGFDGAPTVLGLDDRGREVLQFVEGQVGTLSRDNPLAPWFRTAEACWLLGDWIRRFQAAQKNMPVDPSLPWRLEPGRALAADEVIVHHDVSPHNTVRVADGHVVVLDWDFARPGTRWQDIAWASWRWSPLMAGQWWWAEYGVESLSAAQQRQRDNLAALWDGYGVAASERHHLMQLIGSEMIAHARSLENMAQTDTAFARLVETGYARHARDDASWWAEHAREVM